MAKKAKRIYKKFAKEERIAYQKELAAIEADKQDVLAQGRAVFAAHEASRKALDQLKAERIRQGLSLTDIRDRSGIGREAISKLENDEVPNPTVRTLIRYASALGVKLELKVGK